MADQLAGGNLAGILRQMRSERKSLTRIARELHALHGIDVTPQTVGNWCDLLDIEKPALASVSTPDSEKQAG